MKIYDISQEVYSCAVFPGDSVPEREVLLNIAEGDTCNLSRLSMCVHNGTHVDAPYHFVDNGKKIDEIDLSKFVGSCFVITFNGEMLEDDARAIAEDCVAEDSEAAKRLLFKGTTVVSLEAANVFADYGVFLIGNESQTVGPEEAPKAVHDVLLGAEVVLLEGIRLADVPDGVYILNSAPINLGGSDGAPCRALLIEL